MYMNLKLNKHKIIYFITTTMTSLGFIIVGNPPLPLVKGRGVGPSENCVTWGGGTKFFARKGGLM